MTQTLVFSIAFCLNLVAGGFSLGSGLLHRQPLVEGLTFKWKLIKKVFGFDNK